jgi:2-methylcitrate dehydratase
VDVTADRLVGFAAGLRFEDLPARTVHAVKRCVVDAVGCALAAFPRPEIASLRALAARHRADAPATLFGTRVRTTPELAGFVNGCMVRCLDFNDDYFGGSGDLGPHPSDNLGGVLAAAESAGRDGRALVEGVVIAYETVGQIVDQLRAPGRDRTWDYTVLHAAGTALGAGRVLGLSPGELRHALGLAVVANVGLYQTRSGELSHWKGFAGPHASRGGLVAAQLAAAGVTGPAEPFEGRAGLCRHLDNPFDLGPFGDATTPYKVESTYVKALPVRYTNQLAIWIALELRDQVAPDEIGSIVVHGLARDVVTRERHPELWEPGSRETADHSAPYLIAAALVDGEISGRTFTAERYRDPAVLALAARISFAADPEYSAAFPATLRNRLEVTLRSGRRLTLCRDNPKGHPGNPMSDQELERKFLGQVRGVLPDRRSRALLDQLWALDELADVAALLRLTRVPAGSAHPAPAGRSG